MQSRYKIREMTIKDIEAVAFLELECFSVPWSKEALEESFAQSHSYFVVAEIDEIIVGYGGVYILYEDAEITNIAVTPLCRKQGIGELLVKDIIRSAVEKGAKSILLEVRQSNVAAIGLYEKCGFETIGTRKNFYEKPVEDAVIMWNKKQ